MTSLFSIKNQNTTYNCNYEWDIIRKNICDAYLNYIHVYYNINIVDEDPGSYRYLYLTKLKSFIDDFTSINFDLNSFLHEFKLAYHVFAFFNLEQLEAINFTSSKEIDVTEALSFKELIKYCVPFIKDANILTCIYNIDNLLSSSLHNNSTTSFNLID